MATKVELLTALNQFTSGEQKVKPQALEKILTRPTNDGAIFSADDARKLLSSFQDSDGLISLEHLATALAPEELPAWFSVLTFKCKDKAQFLSVYAEDNGAKVTRAAKGNKGMDVLTCTDGTDNVVLFEKWACQADQEAYMKMRAETGYLDAAGGLCDGVTVQTFTLASEPGLANTPLKCGPVGGCPSDWFSVLTFTPKDKKQFLSVYAEDNGAKVTRAAAGHKSMDVLTSSDGSSTVVLFERWASKADQEAYMKMRGETGYLDAAGALCDAVTVCTYALASEAGLVNALAPEM